MCVCACIFSQAPLTNNSRKNGGKQVQSSTNFFFYLLFTYDGSHHRLFTGCPHFEKQGTTISRLTFIKKKKTLRHKFFIFFFFYRRKRKIIPPYPFPPLNKKTRGKFSRGCFPTSHTILSFSLPNL